MPGEEVRGCQEETQEVLLSIAAGHKKVSFASYCT